jgi:predicted PurR-regulated permease PerM
MALSIEDKRSQVDAMNAGERARYRAFRVWAFIGILIIAAACVWVLGQFSDAVMLVVLAALFTFLGHAPVDFLERHGINRTLGSILTIILYLALFAVIIWALIPFFTAQVKAIAAEVPTYVAKATAWFESFRASNQSFFQNETVTALLQKAGQVLSSKASSIASSGASGIISLGTSIGSTIVTVVMASVGAFWILRDLPKMGKEFIVLVGPRYEEDTRVMGKILHRVVGGYIKGLAINSTCTGIIAWIGFAIIGVPYSGVLGLLTGILNIIPYIGPWFGGAIAAIVAIFVSPLCSILSIVVSICAQQITDTFISPRVMSSTVEIHPALVIFALTAGGCVGGIVGMIAAVPAAAAAKAIYVYYFEKRTGRHLVSEDGAFFKGGEKTQEDDVETTEHSPAYDAIGPDEGVTQRFKRVSSERSERAKSRRSNKNTASVTKLPIDSEEENGATEFEIPFAENESSEVAGFKVGKHCADPFSSEIDHNSPSVTARFPRIDIDKDKQD